MTRLHVVPIVLGRYIVIEFRASKPAWVYGPLFEDSETAQVFKCWLERYRESSVMDPPTDVIADVAEALQKFMPLDLGDVVTAAEVLDAFLGSEMGRAVLKGGL